MFYAGVRKDLKNRKTHSYLYVVDVYGRKPIEKGVDAGLPLRMHKSDTDAEMK